MDQQLQQLLQTAGRGNWTVVSAIPLSRSVNDYQLGEIKGQHLEETGEWVAIIQSPSGQQQQLFFRSKAGGSGYEQTRPMQDVDTPVERNVQTYAVDGVVYERDPQTGKWSQAQGIPAAGSKGAPTPGDKWQPVKDDKGNTIAMQDPVTGDRVAVQRDATPDKPQLVNYGGKLYTWDGTNLVLKQDDSKPEKPDRTQVQNPDGSISILEFPAGGGDPKPVYTTKPGEQIELVKWKDGSQHALVTRTNPATGEKQFIDTGEIVPSGNAPKDSTRQNVKEGYIVTEVADGQGNWTIDPSVPPKPYVPEKPTAVTGNTTDKYILTRQPDGSLKQEPNPNFTPQAGDMQKILQDRNDTLAYVQGLIEQGLMTPAEASQYMDRLDQATNAALMGTNVWNQTLEAQRQKELQAATGKAVLTDRVGKTNDLATTLISKAFDVAGKGVNFDFSQFMPFSGAQAVVDQGYGGQGVMSAAAQALMGGLTGGPGPGMPGGPPPGSVPVPGSPIPTYRLPSGLSPSAQALLNGVGAGAKPSTPAPTWSSGPIPGTTPTQEPGNLPLTRRLDTGDGWTPESPPPGYHWDEATQSYVPNTSSDQSLGLVQTPSYAA